MKRLWLIIVVFVLLSPITMFAEKMVTLPESELLEYLNQISKDDTIIKTLREENYKLKIDKMNLTAEAATWKLRDDKQMGFYLGGAIGYPFPSGEVVALYKFRKWGLFASGGYYGKAPAINVGVMVKTK